jgi:DNA-binding transcriptional MerR regulator
MALEGGFTINQARTLIHGFSDTASQSQRWRTLATQKLKEVRLRMAQLQHAEKLLERATRYQCISLTDCADLLLQREQTASEVVKAHDFRHYVPVGRRLFPYRIEEGESVTRD